MPSERERPAKIVNVVRKVYGGGDDWKATMRTTLQLNESLDENLRAMWFRNQEIAKKTNQVLTPEEFARMIVDENFLSLID